MFKGIKTISHQAGGFIAAHYKIFLTFSLIILQVWSMASIFFQAGITFPTGWDAPFYISHSQVFLLGQDPGSRIGSVALVGLAHVVTGVDLIRLYTYYPIFLLAILAIASALLSTTFSKSKFLFFNIIFAFVFWYPPYFALSISTFDNALAVALMIFSFYFLSVADNKLSHSIPFFLTTIAVGLIHLETFIFLLATVFAYLAIRWIMLKKISVVLQQYGFMLAFLLFSSVIIFFQWNSVIVNLFHSYATPAGADANASIPYLQNSSFADFLTYAKTGLGQKLALVFFGFGTLSILYFMRKSEYQSRLSIIAAYVLSAYGLLLYTVFRGSIPINRSILLLPVPLIMSFGFGHFLLYLERKTSRFWIILVTMLLLIVLIPIKDSFDYVKKYPKAIEASTFSGLSDLRTHLDLNDISEYVIVANTPTDYSAAGPYYGLWNNWAVSLLARDKQNSHPCLYFGTFENAIAKKQTIRIDDRDYNETSFSSVGCLKNINTSTVPIFMIRNMYTKSFPPSLGEGTVYLQITENLIRVLNPV